MIHIASAAKRQKVTADFDCVIHVRFQRAKFHCLAINHQREVRILFDQAQSVTLNLIHRTVPLGDRPAVQFQIDAITGANFKWQVLDRAEATRQTVHSDPTRLLKEFNHGQLAEPSAIRAVL